MANVIAVIWDFDKTLVSGYMQDPIFRKYGVDAAAFWREVNDLPRKYWEEQGVRTNQDTIYLNHFIHCAQPGGILEGLNNEMLRSFGQELNFYRGIPEIFQRTKAAIAAEARFQEYGIKVEHYIVSTGFAEVIRGSSVMEHVDAVWGCELIEREVDGRRVIAEIGYTIDNTSKTRAIFEINKGIPQNPELDVNTKLAEDMRRVRFENMIYIADGPSDIPAFSLINKKGGATFAIYPQGDLRAFQQVEQMRRDNRIQMYAEADYSEGTTAYMWICNRIHQYAEQMCQAEKSKLTMSISSVPRHI